MSQKFNSKNLSYNTSLPPFLAALHAQTGGGSGSGERTKIGQQRASKKRSASEDAEDVPLVVDKNGDIVSLQVDKDGTVVESEGGDTADKEGSEAQSEKKPTDDPSAKTVFGARKRKVGKVVGDAAEAQTASEKKSAKPRKDETEKDDEEVPKDRKPKKKAKKIKLSFDEEEG